MQAAARSAVRAHPLRAQSRRCRHYNYDYSDASSSQGADGSAPHTWGKGGAAQFDDDVKQMKERQAEQYKLHKEYGFDTSPKGDASSGGVPVFKLKLTKKSQADIDAEKSGIDVKDLTDAQRENIRLRRNKRAWREDLLQRMRKRLELINGGRSNLGAFNRGDNNCGFFNLGDSNTGVFNKGDYNKGLLCFGQDNTGAVIFGSGSRGFLVFGSKSMGVDVWGDKQRGVCQTSDSLMKMRLRVACFLLVCAVLSLPLFYRRIQRRRRERWLKAMDVDQTDENIEIMMKRGSF
eukprot:TRINITY_DN7348_c3_g2_i1.p1 TRINITY_DN7348_c3_g2~~TRINITY_DN7348_c3_g2_i1.p1  ORF type:complete len:291 (+),score=96.58 TRINITY_DN7348_c3_g2_i1:219-1091(+)